MSFTVQISFSPFPLLPHKRSCNETLSTTVSSAQLARTLRSFNNLDNEPFSRASWEFILKQWGRMENEDRYCAGENEREK